MKLQKLIDQYLAYQKSLGMCPRADGSYLGTFGRFMGARTKLSDVRIERVEAFLAGTGLLTGTWHTKHSILRCFYRYAVSRGYVKLAPLPITVPRKPPVLLPYIYSHKDLCRLIKATEFDRPLRFYLESVTMRTILLLLYGAGLRVSEAINLNLSDVDLKDSLLTVRQTKFCKTRLVPFGPEVGRALARYACRTPALTATGPFFTTRNGAKVNRDTLHQNFRRLCDHAGVRRTDGARFQPRLHDLRHTFAVHRLTSWYRQGADVQRLLQHLSVYLGHVHIRHTQIYLTMTPELLHEAGKRFEHYAKKGITP